MRFKQRPMIRRTAFMSTYIPRQCGIATYTNELFEAFTEYYPDTNPFILALNDTDTGYAYPPRVRFELKEKELISYQRAADFLTMNDVDILSLQHEYGIYGGDAGSYILTLLQKIDIPTVTTLHTILCEPNEMQLKVLKKVAELSNRLVTMSHRGVEFLKEVYQIPEEKIDFIPHGIPDVPFVDPSFYKSNFDVEGKFLLLTFGLLSRNKGIEYVIKALPEIVKHNPNTVYMVLGATHPNVIRSEGESYREYLQDLAKELGVAENVIFNNQFVSQEKLIEYIGAADIYITPYLNQNQITSGTLAYTVGAGKAVISTPYWYAEELLDDGRGVLVPFQDEHAIAEKVVYLLENEAVRHAMRKKAYIFGREMIWSRVAQLYMDSFEKARSQPVSRTNTAILVDKQHSQQEIELPPLNLYHLSRLTDETGILQHAVFTIPNYHEGYTTDDNARALIVAIWLEKLGEDWFTGAEEFGTRYLAFLWYAFDRKLNRFRNFMSYDRRWLEETGSEDSHGRAMWSLGSVIGNSNHEPLRAVAGTLFSWGLQAVMDLNSPRAWAFSMLGIREYLQRFAGDRDASWVMKKLGQRLMDLYLSTNSPDWHWYENTVTYCNAVLPHALLAAGQLLSRNDMVEVALESLFWLSCIQTSPDGDFSPIGNHGFYRRGGERAHFDQQPVEAYDMVSACLSAYRLTGDEQWHKEAQRAFEWLLGANELGIPLYDPTTGGCHDGLHPDRVNQNQGAEATLSFYLSLLEMRLLEKSKGHTNGRNAPITLLTLRDPVDTH